MKLVLATTTTGSRDEADTLAKQLVEKRMAACVQIVPGLTSVYRWKGAVETESEWLLMVKTREDLLGRIEAVLRDGHSYDLPELAIQPIVGGSAAYLGWLRESLAD